MEHQPLHIQLLGTFRLRVGAATVSALHAPRLQELLAFLLLHRDGPQPRRRIAFSLWPDSSEAQALTNLRNLVHQLRHLLPEVEAYLESEGPTLRWRAGVPLCLDVADFERALAQAGRPGAEGAARAALEAAVAAYGGDLLPGCYDEWVLPERERLRQRFLAGLERLVELLEAQRDYPAAIRYAQRYLQSEPLHEPGYLQLMRLHALNGDRAAALQAYQSCAATLRRELAVEPGLALREAQARLIEQPPALERGEAAAALVGRTALWRELLQIWQLAAAGRPQLLILSGEAGIGKTRLAEELLGWAGQQGVLTARARCHSVAGELDYAPVSAWLRSPAVAGGLGRLDPLWLVEIARLLPELLCARPDLPRPGPLGEPWQRQRLFAALRVALLPGARPSLLLLDDLQWCDRASLELLSYLLHDATPARLLVLGTLRPDELDAGGPLDLLLPGRRAEGPATLVELPPLDPAETAALAAELAGRALSREEGDAIYRLTEGNPLFVVETLRAACGERARACGLTGEACGGVGLRLPAGARAVLDWRLARLSPLAHRLAGAAAVAGGPLGFAALARICADLDDESLLCGLDELLRRRILREQPGGLYSFSHAGLREAAYEQLSAARRQVLQRRAAAAHGRHQSGQPSI